MLLRHLSFSGLILATIIPCQVLAKNITGTIVVKTNVISSCQVIATGSENPLTGNFDNIVFDATDWMSHKPINAENLLLTVTCTDGNTPIVKLNQGKNYGGSNWYMVNGIGKKIAYQLFSDRNHSTQIVPGKDINTARSNPFNVVIAGQMMAIQEGNTIATGDYSDTIQMTVDWSGA